MTLISCVLCVIILAWFEYLCLFVICFKCFYIIFYQSFLTFVPKIQKHKKVENPKSLIGIVVFCHKHVLPYTFIQMALCIYERSLFSMHSYHRGKNLDIYVIVVNRSSNLS